MAWAVGLLIFLDLALGFWVWLAQRERQLAPPHFRDVKVQVRELAGAPDVSQRARRARSPEHTAR